MKLHPSLLFERGVRVRRIWFSRSASSLLAAILVSLVPFASAVGQSLFVSSPEAFDPGSQQGVERFNPATGASESIFTPNLSVVGIAFGPTGDLFAASFDDQAVYRIDGTTGLLKATISGTEVSRPVGLTVGPDGDVYVTDNASNRVVRYDGRSGVYKGVFASGGGVVSPWHLVFGPDGDLYVASSGNGQILRYDGTTGSPRGIFASSGSVTSVFGLAFGPDGNLYVSASTNDPIFRFNGTTGAFMGAFTSGRQLNNADGVIFGPDGDLYVANFSSREVARFDGTSGVFELGISSSTLGNPSAMAFTPEAKVLNISTRLAVQTGDNVLIAGFIITGQDPKNVIVRAIGPSVAGTGQGGALADPTLELHDSTGTLIATNNDWRVTQLGGVITSDQQAAIEASTIPPTNDLESAIVARLAPGAYTAIVQGVNGGQGVGLAEVYDLNQATPSKLANISTRGFVDIGENVMIGGFIVRPGGGTETDVILRAIGPSLGSVVTNALGDPTLELHDVNGALLAANDNWRDSQQAEIQATGIAPTNDAESAIVAHLTPGAYTAILRGQGGTTGVAVVELYTLN
jgi:sugar lactone lactonase YvrE